MTIEQLNLDYGIAGQLTFVDGEGGLSFIEVNNGLATALISIYGGQVLAFQPTHEAEDLLFLSKKAYYQDGKAIKGGIPICWPWFGPHPTDSTRSAHGFARNRFWHVVGTEALASGATKIVLGFADGPETQSLWPHRFEMAIAIVVGPTLSLELITRNTGTESISITQAFHTYFNVGDISQVQVLGLENTTYIDKVDNSLEKQQQGPVMIAAEVDRIYRSSNELVIDDPGLGRKIRISSEGNQTAVVWNPWSEITAKMADLEDNDYHRFLCVETTNAAEDVVEIPAGQEFQLRAHYSIERG